MEDEDEDLGLDVDTDGVETMQTISIEEIADLFGVQEVLGCGATLEEYTTWYNALGYTTDEPVDIDGMYATYVAICDADGIYYIPPTASTPVQSGLKTIALIGGAALLYSAITKK